MKDPRLDNIRQDVRKILKPYLIKLTELHKDNIVSIALYGSATGKPYIPKKSDINLFVLLKSMGFRDLKSSLKLVNHGISRRISAPLFLSISHIETSKDVFPLEFLEIKENHILLYGEDIFSNLQIGLTHLRLFCEREIKGKLIRLRQAYLEVGLRKKGIEALIKESMDSLLPIFRALIRIKGRNPSIDKEQIIKDMADLYNIDKALFMAILKDRADDEKIKGQDIEIIFEKYLDQIKLLASTVDKL